MVVSSLLNLYRAACHGWITVLQFLLNQSVLCLSEGEVFDIVSFAIEITVSVKCFVRSLLFGN